MREKTAQNILVGAIVISIFSLSTMHIIINNRKIQPLQPIYINQVVDANTLSIYMRENFTWMQDQVPIPYVEYLQLPAVLNFSRHGDCDDFAIFSNSALKTLYYQSQIYTLFYVDNGQIVGHAITVYLDNNVYNIFTNQYIFTTLETDPISAIKKCYPSWLMIYKFNPVTYGYLTLKQINESLSDLIKRDENETKEYFNLLNNTTNIFVK